MRIAAAQRALVAVRAAFAPLLDAFLVEKVAAVGHRQVRVRQRVVAYGAVFLHTFRRQCWLGCVRLAEALVGISADRRSVSCAPASLFGAPSATQQRYGVWTALNANANSSVVTAIPTRTNVETRIEPAAIVLALVDVHSAMATLWLPRENAPEYYCRNCKTMTLTPMPRDGYVVCVQCGLINCEFWFEPGHVPEEILKPDLVDIVADIAGDESTERYAIKCAERINVCAGKRTLAEACVVYANDGVDRSTERKVRRLLYNISENTERSEAVAREVTKLVNVFTLTYVRCQDKVVQFVCENLECSSKICAAVVLHLVHHVPVDELAKCVKCSWSKLNNLCESITGNPSWACLSAQI